MRVCAKWFKELQHYYVCLEQDLPVKLKVNNSEALNVRLHDRIPGFTSISVHCNYLPPLFGCFTMKGEADLTKGEKLLNNILTVLWLCAISFKYQCQNFRGASAPPSTNLPTALNSGGLRSSEYFDICKFKLEKVMQNW